MLFCKMFVIFAVRIKNKMNNEIQRIISGESPIRYGTNINAVISYLGASEKSSTLDKTDKHFKREEITPPHSPY